jgi:hypothetical protein
VVQSDVESHLLVGESGEKPHPPEGLGLIEGDLTQPFTFVEQFSVACWRIECLQLDVLGKVDCLRVDPEWGSVAEAGPAKNLAEPGKPGQATFHMLPEDFDAVPPVAVERTLAVKDGDYTDVQRPAVVVGPEHC